MIGEFYVAMRLIAMAQNGQPLTVQRFQELTAVPFAMARLEGVPPPPNPSTAPASYAITEEEKIKYKDIFSKYDSDQDGFIQGGEAVNLFQMSGMDRGVRSEYWGIGAHFS